MFRQVVLTPLITQTKFMSKAKKLWTIIGSLVALLIGVIYFIFGVYDKSENLQDKYPMPFVMFAAVIVVGIACVLAEHWIKKIIGNTES